jgi:hypothetical protein
VLWVISRAGGGPGRAGRLSDGFDGQAVITGLAVTFCAAATRLIPPQAARSAWRHLRARAPLRYRRDL